MTTRALRRVENRSIVDITKSLPSLIETQRFLGLVGAKIRDDLVDLIVGHRAKIIAAIGRHLGFGTPLLDTDKEKLIGAGNEKVLIGQGVGFRRDVALAKGTVTKGAVELVTHLATLNGSHFSFSERCSLLQAMTTLNKTAMPNRPTMGIPLPEFRLKHHDEINRQDPGCFSWAVQPHHPPQTVIPSRKHCNL